MAAKKAKKSKKKAPAAQEPVPFNKLYPDATKMRWVQNFLNKRSK